MLRNPVPHGPDWEGFEPDPPTDNSELIQAIGQLTVAIATLDFSVKTSMNEMTELSQNMVNLNHTLEILAEEYDFTGENL